MPNPLLVRQLTDALCTEVERVLAENQDLLLQIATFKNSPPAASGFEHGKPNLPPKSDEVQSYLPAYLPTNVDIPEIPHSIESTHNTEILADVPISSDGSGKLDNSMSPPSASPPSSAKALAVAKSLTMALEERTAPELQKRNEALSLKGIVSGTQFETFFGFLIFMNAVTMALSSQFSGVDIGYDLGYHGYPSTAKEFWHNLEVTLYNIEFVLGVFFVFELVLKLCGLQRAFFVSVWNFFDAIVVIAWLALQAKTSLYINPMLLRLLRLTRLARLVRLLKNLEAFDSLRVMVRSISACVPVLLWSTVVLFFVQLMGGLLLNNLLVDEIMNVDRDFSERMKLYEYFGTFSRCMITMTELTLGNFVPVCRLLTEKVDESYGIAILTYKITVGFSLLKVIGGVFLHETFKAAASDDELMVVQKKRAQQKHEQKMMRLFKAADEKGEGYIRRDHFNTLLQNQTLRTWLSAQEVEVGDGLLLFDLMDDGDEKLSPAELINGIARLKGTARSIDLIGLMHLTSHLSQVVSKLDETLDSGRSHSWQSAKLQSNLTTLRLPSSYEL